MQTINTLTKSQALQLFRNYMELSDRASTFEQWCERNQVVIESGESLSFTRIKNDTNGNPRYVVHFFALNTDAERTNYTDYSVSEKYELALKRTRTIGGRKFHNKQYGGGIVFQSYSLPELMADIARVTGREFTSYETN